VAEWAARAASFGRSGHSGGRSGGGSGGFADLDDEEDGPLPVAAADAIARIGLALGGASVALLWPTISGALEACGAPGGAAHWRRARASLLALAALVDSDSGNDGPSDVWERQRCAEAIVPLLPTIVTGTCALTADSTQVCGQRMLYVNSWHAHDLGGGPCHQPLNHHPPLCVASTLASA